jgi:glycine/D-amino acid oxidase-like deaminating enzyme
MTRAAIIGGGIMGLSAAWSLRKRGFAVVLYEQGPLPNPLGSSVDRHRLIRYAYGDQDGYVRMVTEAYGAWAELWSDLGQKLYVETGTLAFDTAADDWAGRSRASLERCGIPFELLPNDRLARRFPHLLVDDIGEALYLPSGGVLMAERIVIALAAHLATAGVTIHAETRVASIDPTRATLALADGTSIGADVLIVAAGPWSNRLVPDLAARMTPSRQVVTYLAPPARHVAAWARSPMVLAIGADSGFYAVPPAAGLGLKIGDHRFSLTGDPDRNRLAGNDEAEAIVARARDRFRDFADYRIALAKTCFYDVEAEERFIVEPVGPQSWVMSGFSGHGFKFGPVLGQRLAAAIAGEIAPISLTTWAAGREGL